MADNTRQAETMVWLKTNLDNRFADRDDVFVAMDLLWYPVQGHPEIRLALDILIAFGRPKGHRGSYKQWEEGDIVPQVVFEIPSPGNRMLEMPNKFDFCEQYGVDEYYIYNPENFDFSGWVRRPSEDRLRVIDPENAISPLMQIRFDAPGDREWQIYFPDGTSFRSPVEVRRELNNERQARRDAETRAERLAAKLRELGIEPDIL
jgi:Uma2 family endonuclease